LSPELAEKLSQISRWSETKCSLTRFGVVRNSVLDSYDSRPITVDYLDPDSIGPAEMDSEQIFPFKDSLLITLARVTAASPVNHDVVDLATLCWGRFLRPEHIYDSSRYRVPGQTIQAISMITGRITTRPKLQIEGPHHIILDVWLDRMGSTQVQQLDDQAEAEQLFNTQVDETMSCSCGILLKLLMDLQGEQLLNLALYTDTDRIF